MFPYESIHESKTLEEDLEALVAEVPKEKRGPLSREIWEVDGHKRVEVYKQVSTVQVQRDEELAKVLYEQSWRHPFHHASYVYS